MSIHHSRSVKSVLAVVAVVAAQSTFVATAPAHSADPAPVVSFSATDKTKVPHYFGPYPNWANSPQTLADAIVTLEQVAPAPVSVGNALVERAFATDSATAPGTLAPVFVVLPGAKLPAGPCRTSRSSTRRRSGEAQPFRRQPLARLRPAARRHVANKYTVVYDSGELTVPAPATPPAR